MPHLRPTGVIQAFGRLPQRHGSSVFVYLLQLNACLMSVMGPMLVASFYLKSQRSPLHIVLTLLVLAATHLIIKKFCRKTLICLMTLVVCGYRCGRFIGALVDESPVMTYAHLRSTFVLVFLAYVCVSMSVLFAQRRDHINLIAKDLLKMIVRLLLLEWVCYLHGLDLLLVGSSEMIFFFNIIFFVYYYLRFAIHTKLSPITVSFTLFLCWMNFMMRLLTYLQGGGAIFTK